MHSLRMTAVAFLSMALLTGAVIPGARAADGSPSMSSPLAITIDKVVPPGSLRTGSLPASGLCTPILGVDPDPVDFGPVQLNEPATLTVTLTDLEEPVPPCGITIESIELTLSFGVYSLDGLPSFPITVPVDSAMTFQVRFAPSSPGVLNGLMQITSDDAKNPVREVSVRGEGVENEPPTCAIGGPYAGTQGKPVNFDGSGSSDSDGSIISYAWDFGDGGTGNEPKTTHAYAKAGEFTVTLIVTDDDGAPSSCQTTATITLGNEAPVCAAGGPYIGTPGKPVAFDGTGSSDADGTIISYVWDFGDGGTDTGATPTHTYASDGELTVSLIVTDDDAVPSSCSTTATVTTPSDQIRAAVPPRVFAPPGADVPIPIVLLDDVTGQEILSAEITIAYNPLALVAEGVTLIGTIGQGGSFEWDVEEISESEEIVRMAIAWATPIAGCNELAFINFRSRRDLEDLSPLDLEIVFNEGTPAANALDGEFAIGRLGDTNCSTNISPGDASLVLQSAVGSIEIGDPRYPCLTIEIADVSGNEEITAFDGSLILRYVLGLIERFPIEETLNCSGEPARAMNGLGLGRGLGLAGGDRAASLAGTTPRLVALGASPPIEGGAFDVTLAIDDLTQVLAGDFTLRFNPTVLRVIEVEPLMAGEHALAESRIAEGEVHLAVALAAEGRPGGATVARVRFLPLGDRPETETALDLVRADLNEGAIPVTPVGVTVSLPGTEPAGGPVRVTVPGRVFAAADTDLLIPVFLEDDVTGLEILAAEIIVGYDPVILAATGASLSGTIGEGGVFDFDVMEGEEGEEVHLSIVWTKARAGCGTLANLAFHVSQEVGAAVSPLDLEISFNEGTPKSEAGDGEFVRGVPGDSNASGNLSSLDASLILNTVVGQIHLPDPQYPNLVPEIVDVSGNLEIRAFDAALVLRRMLGIIDRFPIEGELLECGGDGGQQLLAAPDGAPAGTRQLHVVWIAEKDGVIEAALVLDDGAAVAAVEAALVFDPSLLEVIDVTAEGGDGHVLVASRTSEGRVDVASVLARPAAGETDLLRVRFSRLGAGAGVIRVEKPSLNEGAIPVAAEAVHLPGAPPLSAGHLGQNRPNPFNPSTEIVFTTPVAGRVTLAVYDLNGRRVRSLVEGEVTAGEHVALWDARDDHGRPVGAGVYLYALHAGGFTSTRKMIVIQ